MSRPAARRIILALSTIIGVSSLSKGAAPNLVLTVQDLTTGQPITSGEIVPAGDEFQVTVTSINGVNCAGQWAVTALGAPGALPSVLVQAFDYVIGPASGGNSATGEPLYATTLPDGTNDWKVSATCNGAPVGQIGTTNFEFFVGNPTSTGGQPAIELTVQDLTTGVPIGDGQTVSTNDEFQVTVTTANGVDCAGQWIVTALGAPGSPPSVLVQEVPFTIGPASGGNSATGGTLSATALPNGTNTWNISASCGGAGRGQFGANTFDFLSGIPMLGLQNRFSLTSATVSNSALCLDWVITNCFSVQQNFWIGTPETSPAYWAQNIVFVTQELPGGPWYVASAYQLWTPSHELEKCGPGFVLDNSCVYLPFNWMKLSSQQVTITSQILPTSGGDNLSLSATLGGNTLNSFTISGVLPTNSFVLAALSSFQAVQLPVYEEPELVTVGEENSALATFSSPTMGAVATTILLNGGSWKAPGTVAPSVYQSGNCIATGETAVDLLWTAPTKTSQPATFTVPTQEDVLQEGIIFFPAPNESNYIASLCGGP